MLRTARLANASNTAVRAQSHLARLRLGTSSPFPSRSPHSQSLFSRRIFSTGATYLQDNSQNLIAQKSTNEASSEARWPRIGSVEELGRLLRVTPVHDHCLTLDFEHHSFPKLSHLLFRDACLCAHCVSESSGQKNFATCDVDVAPQLESSKVLEDGSLELVWAGDFMSAGKSHTSIYPSDFLQRLLVHRMLPEFYVPERYVWDRAFLEENMEARAVSYDSWMAGGETFAKGLADLLQWGLVIVKGVPETKEAVEDIADKIGNLQSTFYGKTWDVISKPNAENVAYTNEFLCLHQDLMYYTDIPFVQLLHCMKNDCQGGDSLFSDGFRAAVEMQYRDPSAYTMLASRRVNFQYSRNGHYYRQPRPVIKKTKEESRLPLSIHWSPPFQGPFTPLSGAEGLSAWHKAAKVFKNSLEAPENMLQYRMQPGDCILFDNSRILHGRTRFDTSSGLRHLHGGYLNRQTVVSAVRREIKKGYITHLQVLNTHARNAEMEQAVTRYGKAGANGIDHKRQSAAGQTTT